MPGANYSDLQTFGGLEEMYGSTVVTQLNVLATAYYALREASAADEVNLDGQGFNLPVKFALNESYASLNDGERLPDSGMTKDLFAKYRTKLNYAGMELTSFAATRGYAGGRADGEKYIDDLLKSTILSMTLNSSADVLGNGFGYRATVQTATPGASSFTVTFSGRIRPTMVLDWYDSTLTTLRGTIQISDNGIDSQARLVHVSSTLYAGVVPAGATAGDVLVVHGALDTGVPSDGRGVSGFGRVTDNSASLGNLSPSNYAWWKSLNINANLQNPNEIILQQLTDNFFSTIGTFPDKGLISPDWKRALWAGAITQRQFTSSNFELGATNLSFSPVQMGTNEAGRKPGKLQWYEDHMMDPSEVFVWADQSLFRSSDYNKGIHIADDDGNDFRFRIHYDSQNGFLRNWFQVLCSCRRGVGKAYGFATPAGVI